MMGFFFQILSGKKMELLPGDRDNLAIQTRGGPEKHEVTGWVLVSTNTTLCHCCSGTNQNRPWCLCFRSRLWPKKKKDRTSVTPQTPREKLQQLEQFTWLSPSMSSLPGKVTSKITLWHILRGHHWPWSLEDLPQPLSAFPSSDSAQFSRHRFFHFFHNYKLLNEEKCF